MTEYSFCRECKVPRYVVDFTEIDYAKAGWVKEMFRRVDASGIFFERLEHLCPDCRQKEIDEEKRREEEWKKLYKASMENDPTLYQKIMRERAS